MTHIMSDGAFWSAIDELADTFSPSKLRRTGQIMKTTGVGPFGLSVSSFESLLEAAGNVSLAAAALRDAYLDFAEATLDNPDVVAMLN